MDIEAPARFTCHKAGCRFWKQGSANNVRLDPSDDDTVKASQDRRVEMLSGSDAEN